MNSGTNMKRTIRNFAIRILAVTLAVTAGVVFTFDDASAAVSAPGKVNLKSATRSGGSVTLKWTKTKNADGYSIYRKAVGVDAKYKFINNYSVKRTSITYKSHIKGVNYRYVMRAYKTYKVKQWYNKKTKKWQAKKPKKKHRGKSRKVTKKKYGAYSAVRQVAIPIAAPTNVKASWDKYNGAWCLDTVWKSVAGAKKYNVYRDGKKVKTLKVTYLYEQKVSGNVNHKIQVSAVSAAGKESAKTTITAPKSPAYKTTKPTTTTTKPNTSPTLTPQGNQTTTSWAIPEQKTISLSYNGTTIYLGQKWSNTLYNNLKSGASGTAVVSRPQSVCRWIEYSNGANAGERTWDETVYMIDTGDYDKFLAVYVTNGQIVRWVSNLQNMGKNGSTTFTRGMKTMPASSTSDFFYSGDNQGCLIGGFEYTERIQRNLNESMEYRDYIENEKNIGIHFVNALRYLFGSAPLEYNDYLDGKDYVLNGTYTVPENWSQAAGKTYKLTNQRYGAQAWAETMAASGKISHSTLTKGPLAGNFGYLGKSLFIAFATDYTVVTDGVQVVGGGIKGEEYIEGYQSSADHTAHIVDSYYKKCGFGMWGGYQGISFSTR